jgi:type II secretory ATPase GspE/PulE/Tfp pilus assembly ATPase PilB-like protein
MVSMMSLIGKEIGELLVDGGLLTPAQLEIAEQEKLNTGETISRVLNRLGLASENQIKDTLELQYGVTYVSLIKLSAGAEIIKLLPEKLIRQHQVLPIDYQNGRLTLAMVNPDDPLSVIDIKNHIEFDHLKTVVCMEDDFESFVEAFFAPEEPEPVEMADTEQAVEAESTVNGVIDLGDLLISAGILDDDQVFSALKRGLKEKKELAEVLIQMKLITQEQLESLMLKAKGVTIQVPEPVTEKPGADNGKGPPARPGLPEDKGNGEDAMPTCPTSTPANTLSQSPLPTPEEPGIASPVFDRMRRTVKETHFDLNAAFGPVKMSLDEIDSPDPQTQFGELEDDIDFLELVKQAQDASISLVANHITLSAVESRCSDIHIHGTVDDLVVQYFVHGNLINESRLEKQLLAELVACYKDIAGLNRAETVKPQDKRIRMKILDFEVEMRITTIPEDTEEMVAITLKYLT